MPRATSSWGRRRSGSFARSSRNRSQPRPKDTERIAGYHLDKFLSMRKRLPASVVRAIDESKTLGIRAGRRSDHWFIGVWPVVVEGRVIARSWTLKPNGWYQTLLTDPYGTIQVGGREIAVRALRVRSERIRDAVEAAYA